MPDEKPRKTFHHSTVGRRDFMKYLGLGSVGMGAVAMGLPSEMPFADLDDMMSSEFSERHLPFWVKEVDKPTVEIDWDTLDVFPNPGMTLFNPMMFGLEDAQATEKKYLEKVRGDIINKTPGYSIQDHALNAASSYGWQDDKFLPPWTGPEHPSADFTKFGHATAFATPEEMGVPRYEGTPVENSKMLRVAGRIMGSADMGFVKLDEHTKKLIYGNIVFEDVEEGYMDPERHLNVLPNKDLWVICSVIPQSLTMGQLTDRMSWAGANAYAYSRASIYSSRIKMFLRGLGYQQYGDGTAGIGRAVGFGVMAGLAEYCRASIMVSPMFGTSFRTVMLTITDMPLAVTKPIDAGIMKFCRVCKKCAEECPSGAINMDTDPKWPDWEPSERPNVSRGIKGWFLDPKKCLSNMFSGEPDCSRCQVVCPFNKYDSAVMHDLVKLSIGTAPALDSAIRKMDDVFGYGKQRGDSLWDADPWDIPLFGLDSSRS